MWRLEVYAVNTLPLPLPDFELVAVEYYRWRWVARFNQFIWDVMPPFGDYHIATELTHDEDRGDSTPTSA